MASKLKKTGEKQVRHNPGALTMTPRLDETPEQIRARAVSNPVIRGIATATVYSQKIIGDLDRDTCVKMLERQVNAVHDNDLSGVETMLTAQANTLDTIFNQLAYKSAHCDYLNQVEANMRLALKAQAQCRATLETLAEIKTPRQIAFVKQANIAHQQQVNNGMAPPASTRARENCQTIKRTIKQSI